MYDSIMRHQLFSEIALPMRKVHVNSHLASKIRLRCLRLTWQREVVEIELRIVIRLRNQVQIILKRQLRLRGVEHPF